jgi:hypothetical protein
MATRLILTFNTLHQVLSAEKALKTAPNRHFKIRPTPTPPGLSSSICGMSIELLQLEQKQSAIDFLSERNMPPKGIHLVD